MLLALKPCWKTGYDFWVVHRHRKNRKFLTFHEGLPANHVFNDVYHLRATVENFLDTFCWFYCDSFTKWLNNQERRKYYIMERTFISYGRVAARNNDSMCLHRYNGPSLQIKWASVIESTQKIWCNSRSTPTKRGKAFTEIKSLVLNFLGCSERWMYHVINHKSKNTHLNALKLIFRCHFLSANKIETILEMWWNL